jgi:hypothetical protein
VELAVSHRLPHLSIVEPRPEQLRARFHVLTGREPSPAEVKAFARWKMADGLGLPQATRRGAGRIISRT